MIEISPCPEIWVDEFNHWHDWVKTEAGPPALGLEHGMSEWTRLYFERLDPVRGERCDSAIARTGEVMRHLLAERHLWQQGDKVIFDGLGLDEGEYSVLMCEAYERFAVQYKMLLDIVPKKIYYRKQIIQSCL